VVTCTHERSKLCCTTGHTFPSILLLYGAQLMIQVNHCSSPRPRRPTHFVSPSSPIPHM
jgi:hypothetical protein